MFLAWNAGFWLVDVPRCGSEESIGTLGYGYGCVVVVDGRRRRYVEVEIPVPKYSASNV